MKLAVGTKAQIRTQSGVLSVTVDGEGNNEWQTRIRYSDGTLGIADDNEIEEIDEDENQPETFRYRLGRYSEAFKGSFKMLAYAVLGVVLVTLAIVVFKYHATPPKEAPKSEIEILTEELNRLNTEDVPDIGACKRTKVRDARKKEVLQKINALK
jgi:hypothetical protein